ncbi:uncharacterized protein EV420DRAFT_384601 [Desarmillaria tabescens]|uniref:Protein kinase domain-containing protein n=1 Tax=Armillaria tabescens TaxID=1929756 RepID=A0AA39KBP0_ARMTA|nr:uncharacterized protein EV420DRAFT_384601 [Desarmillaria tabescens]KAK0458197.1 hypothetical protein EV420DRAFT_384601 [Desarmillaria tabescens]
MPLGCVIGRPSSRRMKRVQTAARRSSAFKFSRPSFRSRTPIDSVIRNSSRWVTSSALATQLHSPQESCDWYLPGSEIHLQFQAQDSTTFRPLVAKIIKRLEPFTSSVVLLIQNVSDSKQFILKLNDRRQGHRHSLTMAVGELPWTPGLEERLRAAVRDIQFGTTTDWFELVKDNRNPAQPNPKDWKDWMWEISTWTSRMEEHQTEVEAYRLLRRLQGSLIPCFYGLVHLPIASSQPLHPITDYIPGIVIEYIRGIGMGSLRPGVDIPRPEAEAIAGRVMDAFRTIKAEKCVMHNDIHIDNILLRDSDRSPVLIDFGWALTWEPGMSDEEWEDSVTGSQDTRFVCRVLMSKDHGAWRRKETPLPIRYYSPLSWNEYVENQPEDYRRQAFGRVAGTDWEGAREKVLQWRVRPGVCFRDD